MKDGADDDMLLFEVELDAPPAKVWRAVTVPELRARWLPGKDLAAEVPLSVEEGRSVRYALRDAMPPFGESEVTFELWPCEGGGTRFRITHRLEAPALDAANGNGPAATLMAA